MKATVLLVDDDPVDLKSVELLLSDWGLDVAPVRSGAEALQRLAGSPVDVVVSDVRMPGMSGDRLAEEAVRVRPGLPVILITGHGDIRSAVQAMRRGAFDYLVKPPDEEDFRLTVERAIEHARLRRENAFLRAELAVGGMYGERLVGRSPAMLAVFDVVQRVARTDSTVLILGETGTGKELIAQTLHYKSDRADKPLVALNCAALNPNLIESELFGHEKGAFTGAVAARRGRFEDADGGTLFLDEISETSVEFQANLLRVLQEHEFQRVGGNRPIAADVRLIASTNRDLDREVEEGRFRQDLYYRLNVIPIRLPPLRERKEDIGLLAAHFLAQYRDRYGSSVRDLSPQAVRFLEQRPWPGNVRELQHVIERAVVLARGDKLEPADLAPPAKRAETPPRDRTLQAFVDARTREHLLNVLDETGWHKRQAAELLGVDRVTLYRLLKKHSIERGRQ